LLLTVIEFICTDVDNLTSILQIFHDNGDDDVNAFKRTVSLNAVKLKDFTN